MNCVIKYLIKTKTYALLLIPDSVLLIWLKVVVLGMVACHPLERKSSDALGS